jgi:DNA-directed RNA polymerase subunit RPC12/RpoP
MRARHYCADCLTWREHAETESGEFLCAKCGKSYAARFEGTMGADGLAQCAFCGSHAFFLQKDFDQRLGCLIMAVSLGVALLIGWKFGWIWFTPVLLATVVVDWIVAAKVRPVTICYQCDAEYRDLPVHIGHRGYDPHIAERYAETKTVRRMR